MKLIPSALCVLLLCPSCSTINQSFELGAALGSVGGGLATYAGHVTAGGKASLENVAIGAGLGLGAGLLTAYFVHKQVEADRADFKDGETEMHFGDLPPSPFLMPKKETRKRGN